MSLLRTYAPFILPMIFVLGLMSFVGHVVLDIPSVYADHTISHDGGSDGGGDPDDGSNGGGQPDDSSNGSNQLTNPLKFSSITCLILAIIDVVLIFLIPVIVLYIMYAGFLFVKSQGNPGDLADAKKALVAGLIGGVIVLGARTILSVVEGTISAVTETDSSIIDSGSGSCSSS